MSFDHKEFDLIMSRVCHDLISPVSATMNGIELLQEYGGSEQDEIAAEANELVATSSKNISARLIFFRLAYGGAGSTSDFSIAKMGEIAEGFLLSRNIGFQFECADDLRDQRPETGMVKGILNMLAIAADSLPRGGEAGIITSNGIGDGQVNVEIFAAGDGANIPQSIKDSFNAGEIVGEADTKSILGVLAARITDRFGLKITVEEQQDRVSFHTRISMGEPPIG